MTSPIAHPFAPRPQEAQFGLRIGGLLSSGAQSLAPDIGERLRFAREQALARAGQQRAAVPAPSVASVGAGSLALAGPPAWWLRALAILPLLLLIAGLVGVEQASQREQAMATADVDAVLLADDLPPRAYSDPAFAEFLRSPPP